MRVSGAKPGSVSVSMKGAAGLNARTHGVTTVCSFWSTATAAPALVARDEHLDRLARAGEVVRERLLEGGLPGPREVGDDPVLRDHVRAHAEEEEEARRDRHVRQHERPLPPRDGAQARARLL